MSDGTSETRKLDLGNAAALMALALSTVGVAALIYSLLDLLVVFFLGMVVAAALPPGHVRPCRLGVPKGLAVLCPICSLSSPARRSPTLHFSASVEGSDFKYSTTSVFSRSVSPKLKTML
jgi:hypothetical protein